MITIHLEGAEELIRRITNLQGMQKTKAAIGEAATFLEGKVKEYPTVSRRPNPMIKLSDKVRRGFFYHLKHGDIEVPYRRGQSPGSEKLGQSWNIRTENAGWRAVIGTSVSYARLVQDSAKQSNYHRHTGWITTKQVAALYGRQALSQIEMALKQEVENG